MDTRKLARACLLPALLALLLPWAPATGATEYPIQTVEHLCSKAADPVHYTSELLKSLKYLVEGDDGWIYRSKSDFIEDFGDQGLAYRQLEEFTALLAARGTRLMLVYLPTRGLMNPRTIPAGQYDYARALASYRNKLTRLRSLGLLVPDMERLIQEHQGTDFFFKRDIHWTPTGARATAALVAEAIQATGLIEPQPAYRFINTPAGSYTIQGGMARGVRQLCGDQPIYEYVQGYGATASYQAGENALFADEPEAEAVLIGTSFSALERLNFAGFLQEALQAPVENYALGGGGDEGAWLHYAANGGFSEHPPKLIIWEVPGYYLLDEAGVFAQLTPTLLGGCAEREAIVDERIILEDDGISPRSLFFTKSLLETPLSDVVLDLSFSDAQVHGIGFNVWYSDGKVMRGRIANAKRAATGGRLVFSLFDRMLEPKSNVMALELLEVDKENITDYIRNRPDNPLEVRVKVCTMHKAS